MEHVVHFFFAEFGEFTERFKSEKLALADLGGREGRTPPPGRPNAFDFMQFSGKFGVFTPPRRVHAPPRENPGSATDSYVPVHTVV